MNSFIDPKTVEERATRFAFDRSFEGAPAAHGSFPKTRFTREEVAALERLAFEKGRQSVEAAAAQEVTAIARELLAQGKAQLDALTAERRRLLAESTDLALVVARKLSTRLNEVCPDAEVRAFLANCLSLLRDEPKLTIRIPGTAETLLAPAIEAEARAAGIAGAVRIEVRGAERPLLRLEWTQGAAEFDPAALSEAIEAEVRRFLEQADASFSPPPNE